MIKAIETKYNGYLFRSRLEAKWAVFFDAVGADWEYEPEGFNLGNGLRYLPDFLLHHVAVRDYEHNNDCDVYVEVKEKMTDEDAKKISIFSGYDKYENTGFIMNKVLILGRFPKGEDTIDIFFDCCRLHDNESGGIPFYGFDTLDGDSYAAIPCATKNGKFGIVGIDWCYDIGEYSADNVKTLKAYNAARQARFEHGERPFAGKELPF